MQTIFGKSTPPSLVRPRFSVPDRAPALNRAGPALPASRVSLASPPVAAAKPPMHAVEVTDRSLVESLTQSKLFTEYAQAFTDATGLPVALCPVESWQLPLHGKRHEAPYCALMSQKSRTCSSCLQVQERLSAAAAQEPHTAICPAGLCETAVPVRLGKRLIGYLQTGQVFWKKPTETQFQRTAAMVKSWGVEVDQTELKSAYFATRVMSEKQLESATVLLRIFAQHLALLGHQVVIQRENAEPPVIAKAKAYVQEHQTEHLRLGQVAKAVNTSTFYFCKLFRKATGLNFTDYLSRLRIERSKNLLLNPNLRVSEIAYEVGFQSLTHFNRVFRKLLGESPSDYRLHLLGKTQGH